MKRYKNNPLLDQQLIIKNKTNILSKLLDIKPKLVLFLLYILKNYNGFEVVYIDVKDVMREFNLSQKSVYIYINKLIDKKLIAKSDTISIYHLSPVIFNNIIIKLV